MAALGVIRWASGGEGRADTDLGPLVDRGPVGETAEAAGAAGACDRRDGSEGTDR